MGFFDGFSGRIAREFSARKEVIFVGGLKIKRFVGGEKGQLAGEINGFCLDKKRDLIKNISEELKREKKMPRSERRKWIKDHREELHGAEAEV